LRHPQPERSGSCSSFFNLLPKLTVVQNVELPMIYSGSRRQRRQRAMEALNLVTWPTAPNHRPTQLFRRQQQRAAIARPWSTTRVLFLR